MADIEESKLELEREKLAFEKAKFDADNTFLRKYSTAILTVAGTVLAAIIAAAVSGTQVWIAHIEKDRELAAADIAKKRDVEIAQIERERRWRLDIADMLFKNKDLIFSNKDASQRIQAVSVIATTFPHDLSQPILTNLEKTLRANQPEFADNVHQQIVALSQSSGKFFHVGGSFEKKGEGWTEVAGDGTHTFSEQGRQLGYIYLQDCSRALENNNCMLVRIPIEGGFSQMTYQRPEDWKNLYLETPR
ncbi:hypothetical protein [Caballeronia sp. GAFFF1]|uniref:hypothetical protein n=1 Tax=Caballeronia sp. GAFFF1 TaxID=2921779 RepID=UPI0020292BC2|nr:hypothetical protein [Caballeronia sp. GAFFF1]